MPRDRPVPPPPYTEGLPGMPKRRKGWPLPKVPLIAATIIGVYLLLNFIAPYTIEPGTVRGLDGGANRIDYDELWEDMNPLARAVYWFGDLNCHQKEERTIILNDNQMPFCARDVGLFTGMTLGSLMMLMARPSHSIGETSLSMLPKPLRVKKDGRVPPIVVAGIFWGLWLLPTGFDGFNQLLTNYESTIPVRLVTGALAGVPLAVMLVAPITAALAPWDEISGANPHDR